MSVGESQLAAEHDASPPTENASTLLRGQFSRPTLLFKVKAPKFSPGTNGFFARRSITFVVLGSNNFPQLMKNTDDQANIGQGVSNHLYTTPIIDAKTALIRHLTIPAEKSEIADRSFSVTRIESSDPVYVSKQNLCRSLHFALHRIPIIQFMPASTNNNLTGGISAVLQCYHRILE